MGEGGGSRGAESVREMRERKRIGRRIVDSKVGRLVLRSIDGWELKM